MSLINEALKRADAEKRGQPLPAPSMPRPVEPRQTDKATPPAAVRADTDESVAIPVTRGSLPADAIADAAPPRRPSARWIVAGVIVLLGGLVIIRATMSVDQPPPKQAAGESVLPDKHVGWDERGLRQQSLVTACAQEGPPITTYTVPPFTAVNPGELDWTNPGVPAGSATQPAPAPVAIGSPASPSPEHLEKPATPTPSATTAPAQASVPVPATAPAPYSVSGIMRGPEGWVAVVNGQLVKVGETINDTGKIVKITATTVVIEDSGKKITLRI